MLGPPRRGAQSRGNGDSRASYACAIEESTVPEVGPIVALPPGAAFSMGKGVPGGAAITIPLWLYWMRIAHLQAAAAAAAAFTPDEFALTRAALDTPGTKLELPEGKSPSREMFAAMVAVTATAHALDGLYGVIKPLVLPPASSAARHRQILECLKLGFRLGRLGHAWLADFDWLDDLRDAAVHSEETLRPIVPVKPGAVQAFQGFEASRYSAPNAERAAALAETVIRTCVANPKPETSAWAERYGPALDAMLKASV